MVKRIYDLAFATLGLILLAPGLILIAAAIRVLDGKPVLFKQLRVGLNGRPFQIIKFRTMVPNAPALGGSVTGLSDPRVTRVGRVLRRHKLDEFPQLWNVVAGQMSLVGPRPEVPIYVECYSASQRQVLNLKPGITDLATLLYRKEEQMLSSTTDIHSVYVGQIMPHKLTLNLIYARQAGCWEDTKVILRTLFPHIPLKLKAETQCSTGLRETQRI